MNKISRKKYIIIILFLTLTLLIFFSWKINSVPKKLIQLDTNEFKGKEHRVTKSRKKGNYLVFHHPDIKDPKIKDWIKQIEKENHALAEQKIETGKRETILQDYRLYEHDEIKSLVIELIHNKKVIKTDSITFEDGEQIKLNQILSDQGNRYLSWLLRKDQKQIIPNEERLRFLKETNPENIDNFYIDKEFLHIKNDYFDYNLNLVENSNILDKPFSNFLKNDRKLPSVYLDKGFSKDDKLVALTFDDGPHYETSPKIMDLLEEYDGQATFFMIGWRVESHEDIVASVLDRGHQLANHSFNHPNFNQIPIEEVRKEVNKTNEAFEKATGFPGPYMIRPPYGNANQNVLNNIDSVFVNWSVDTMDWSSKDPQAICQTIDKYAYDGSIILMHDLYESSYEGLKCGIEKLHQKGFKFVTVEELLKAKEIPFQENKLYFDGQE